MAHIRLSARLYSDATRRAADAGFESVDTFVEEVIRTYLDAGENADWFFTPQVLASLDRITTRIDAGENTLTEEEVTSRIEANKAEWRRKNAS